MSDEERTREEGIAAAKRFIATNSVDEVAEYIATLETGIADLQELNDTALNEVTKLHKALEDIKAAFFMDGSDKNAANRMLKTAEEATK